MEGGQKSQHGCVCATCVRECVDTCGVRGCVCVRVRFGVHRPAHNRADQPPTHPPFPSPSSPRGVSQARTDTPSPPLVATIPPAMVTGSIAPSAPPPPQTFPPFLLPPFFSPHTSFPSSLRFLQKGGGVALCRKEMSLAHTRSSRLFSAAVWIRRHAERGEG